MWNFVASWHRYICFYIQLISILLITYIIYTRFSMQNSARQTVSRMYMPFLNDLKILPANPAQNLFCTQFHYAYICKYKRSFMVFSSLFFVFFFLALNLIAYHFADGIKRKNMVLLGFSLVFYSWGGPKYLLLLLSMVFASWLFALLIDQYREEGLSKIFLICDCVFMLGLLCIFKYLTFFSSITNTIFHFPKEIPQIALTSSTYIARKWHRSANS